MASLVNVPGHYLRKYGILQFNDCIPQFDFFINHKLSADHIDRSETIKTNERPWFFPVISE